MSVNTKHLATFILGAAAGVAAHKYLQTEEGEKLFEELLNNNENTLPTHQQKIRIAKVREYVFSEIESQIYTLIAHAKQNDDRQVVIAMKTLVKEYLSRNSKYEALDAEIK